MVDRSPTRQSKIEDRGDNLRITIPIPKQWFALLPWGGMVVISFCMVASGEPFFVLGFGVFGLLLIIWNFLREQVVEVDDHSITIWDEVLGIRLRSKHYLAQNIVELRIPSNTAHGLVAFDYGSATVSFGRSLTLTDACEIVTKINRRFPRYIHGASGILVQPGYALDNALIPSLELPKGIRPPLLRHRSEVLGNKLRITIPSLKKWPMIIFLIVWLTLWSVGGIFAVRAIVTGENVLFLLLWLIFWLFFEIFSIYHLLWQIFGQERIEVTADSLTICQAILGIGRGKQYAGEHIKRIRADASSRVDPYPLADEGISMNKGTGMIAFDYQGETIRMGIGIDEAEAKYLVNMIQRDYPVYMNKGGA